MKPIIFFGMVLLVLGLTHCTEPEVVVTRDMKRSADTTYRNQRDSLLPILDSLCLVKNENLYQTLLDSVVNVRTTERDRILKRNQND